MIIHLTKNRSKFASSQESKVISSFLRVLISQQWTTSKSWFSTSKAWTVWVQLEVGLDVLEAKKNEVVQIQDFKARKLKLCIWPLLIMISVRRYVKSASTASEAVRPRKLEKYQKIIHVSRSVGLEPTLPEGIWFLVRRLNHSATTAFLYSFTSFQTINKL